MKCLITISADMECDLSTIQRSTKDTFHDRGNGKLTLACSIAACAAFSASRCRLSFSFNEKMATDRARFTKLCFNLDFLAANSAAFAAAASSSDPFESFPASIDSFFWAPLCDGPGVTGTAMGTVDEDDVPGLSEDDLGLD